MTEVANRNAAAETRSPLFLRRWLWLTTVLPMAVFILLMLKDYWVVSEQMSEAGFSAFRTVLALAGGGAVIGAAFALFGWRRPLPGGAVILAWWLVGITVSCCLLEDMTPQVEMFVLPPLRWLEYIATFYMPGIFYSLLVLAAMTQRGRGAVAIVVSAVCVCGVPLLVYTGVVTAGRILRHVGRDFSAEAGNAFICALVAFFVIFWALFLFIALRFSIFVCRWAVGKRHFRTVMALLVGLFLPLLGLGLNYSTPFPCDLQCWQVYALALLNFALLAVGVTRFAALNWVTLFLKGAVYWFSLYFFILFMPWLPLAVPAVLFFGVGLLILAPALLFLFQTYALSADMAKMAQTHSRKAVTAVFALGVIATPAVFATSALRDRRAVDELVTSYYHANLIQPAAEQLSALNTGRTTRALKLLSRRINGIEIPYLDELYNAIVFSGLTLSRDKIHRMCHDLHGNSPDTVADFFRRNYSRHYRPMPLSGLAGRGSSEGVRLTSAKAAPVENGARLELEIAGSGDREGEYVGSIHLPQGVFVTGMTLETDGEPVPGKFSERKSAVCVCDKITDECRAPALLYHQNANTLKLLVFPVADTSPRKVTIDLIYPKGDPVTVTIDGRRIELPESCVLSNWRYVSPESLRGSFAKSERKPELVFIVDRTMVAPEASIAKVLGDFPEAQSFRIVSGVVAAGEMTAAPHSGDNLTKICDEYRKLYCPGHSGFAASSVIKGAILQYARMNNRKSYPVFVYVTDSHPLDSTLDLRGFEAYTPEYPYLLEFRGGKGLRAISLANMVEQNGIPAPREAYVLPESRIVAAENGALIPFDQPRQGNFAYELALGLRKRSQHLLEHPATEAEALPQLLADAQSRGQLIFQNACAVPEPSARHKVTERVEESKLTRPPASDITAPEASFWLLLPFPALAALLERLFRKRRAGAE